MELTELLQRLPVAKKVPLLPSAPMAISHPSAPTGFVAPPLRSPRSLPAALPGILVISAPGAVGKSTLARHLAHSRGTAYWDLSKLELGDNTFIGTIAAAFGDSELARVLQGLRDGSTLFVVDALDEAEIRSGWPRVASFLKQVAERTATAPVPTVIVLARTETAQRTSATLGGTPQEHPTCALLEVDYFDEKGARKFVATQLDVIAPTDAHRRHAKPFADALDAVFEQVTAAIEGESERPWEQASVRGVLGYAPFLQAIAAFLSEYENFGTVAEDLSDRLAAEGSDAVLASLLAELLNREQRKFVDQVRELWPSGLDQPAWSDFYSPTEQLARCTRFVMGEPYGAEASTEVPAEIASKIAQSYLAFVPQHPFLRDQAFAGPAFRDYTLASCLAGENDAIFAELQLDSGSFVPTPLLASFFVRLLTRPGNAAYAGYLYDAAVSRFGLDRAAVSTFVSAERGEGVHTLQIVATDVHGRESVALDVSLRVSESSPLTFRRHIRNATVLAEGTLVLDGADGDFELVNADLRATEMRIRARRLQVSAATGTDGESLLRAERCEATAGGLEVVVQEGASLAVSWPGSDRYPWVTYDDPDIDREPADRQGVMAALYRMLKWFRKDKRNELGKLAAFIDNVVVGRHTGRQPLRDALLSFLVERGIMRLNGPIYVVSDEMVKRYGLHLPALRAAHPPKALAQLIDEFLLMFEESKS